MDKVDRLRRDQLAIFVCSRNTIGPKGIQRQEFIVSKRIEESRAAKARVRAQTDSAGKEFPELRLIRPSLIPVLCDRPRCFGDCRRPEQSEQCVARCKGESVATNGRANIKMPRSRQEAKAAHRTGDDENSRSAVQQPNSERPAGHAQAVEPFCELGT